MLDQLLHKDKELSAFSENPAAMAHHGVAALLQAAGVRNRTVERAVLLQRASAERWLQAHRELQKRCVTVPMTVFKGFALSHRHYPEAWMRPHADIDVLIDKSNLPALQQALTALGYQRNIARSGALVSQQVSYLLHTPNQPDLTFDVHWEINNRPAIYRQFPRAELDTQTVHLPDGSAILTLSDAQAFILAAFHRSAHHRADRKHIWLYDLALLWLRMTAQQRQAMRAEAQQKNQTEVVESALQQINALFDLRLRGVQPPTQVAVCESRPGPRGWQDLHERLAQWPRWRDKARYLLSQLFQPTAYVQQRYRLRTRRLVWLHYPRMWLEDALKLLRRRP